MLATKILKNLNQYIKKSFIYSLNKFSSIAFFNAFLRNNKSNKGFIIALHRVISPLDNESEFNNFIEIYSSKLEEIIISLKKLEAKFVSLKELNSILNQKVSLSYPLVHLSFDDGYLDNYSCAFEILKKHNVCFSIFIASDFIDKKVPFVWWYIAEYIIKNEIPVAFEKYDFSITEESYRRDSKPKYFELLRIFLFNNIDSDRKYFEEKLLNYIPAYQKCTVPEMLGWEQINEMIGSGLCEPGVHTKNHPSFKYLTSEEKCNQIKYCQNEIFINTGIHSKYFAYPYGSKNDIGNTIDLKEIMRNCEIDLAFTTIPGELNHNSSKVLLPRIILNNKASMYTLKSRLSGSYQRSIKD